MIGRAVVLALALAQLGPSPQVPQEPANAAAPAPWRGDELVLGQDSAPVTVVEYLSDTCPHCAAFDRDVFPQVRAAYVLTGQVRYVLREVLTPPTELAAVGFLLARCGGRDRYLAAVQDLMRNQDRLFHGGDPRAVLLEIGARAGLSLPAIEGCIADASALRELNDRVQAAAALGIEGTPTFIVNGRKLAAGDRLGDSIYEGGELSLSQFDACVRDAQRRLKRGARPRHPKAAGPQK